MSIVQASCTTTAAAAANPPTGSIEVCVRRNNDDDDNNVDYTLVESALPHSSTKPGLIRMSFSTQAVLHKYDLHYG